LNDLGEVTLGVEAVVAFELEGDVRGIAVVEEHDADVFVFAGSVVEALAEIIGLTGSSEAYAGWLFAIEALEP